MESIKKAALLIFSIGAASGLFSNKALAQSAIDWDKASISTSMVTGSAVVISSSGARYLLDGVVISSTIIGNTGWVTFRDTDVANTSLFTGGGTGITLQVQLSTAASVTSGPRIVNFNPPIRFYRGLAVDATGCGTLNTYCYSVLYRRVSDN